MLTLNEKLKLYLGSTYENYKKFSLGFCKTREQWDDLILKEGLNTSDIYYGYITDPKTPLEEAKKIGISKDDLNILSDVFNKKVKFNLRDLSLDLRTYFKGAVYKVIGICRDSYDWYLVISNQNNELDVIFAYDYCFLKFKDC